MSLIEKGVVPVQPYGQGLASATTWRNIADMTNFLAMVPTVKLFVEIGANFCGLAALMVSRTIVIPDFAYLGLEIEAGRKNANLEKYMAGQPGCEIIWMDCFDKAVKDVVKEWIDDTDGQAVVFCDGTNKPKEMRHYHPLLRVGDYLMMHDYYKDARSSGNASYEDCKPLIDSGQFKMATPDYWAPAAGMGMLKKVKV